MKILHVITGLKKAAGTSVFCGEIANGLVALGHEVTIAVCDSSCQDIYPFDPRIKLVSIASLLTANNQLLTTNAYDLVHIHALWSPILHKVSNRAHKNSIPVVWSPHGMLTPWAMNNKKWKKLFGWWLYQNRDLRKANLLHATAESEVEDIRRMGLQNQIAVAPLGVKINSRVGKTERADGKKILLFVSRIQKKKGLLNLAKAWAALKYQTSKGSSCSTRLQDWKVRIVGPDQEGHTAEVKAECERLGIISDWEFVGPKYDEALQQEYANADLFVLPTHSENFGSVVIEALAHAVPVITTKGTPWAELEKYKCGWWIDIGVGELISTLGGALSATDKCLKDSGQRGLELVKQKYTWDVVVAQMNNEYEAIRRRAVCKQKL